MSPQRRAKRTWAAELPERPGVYLFVAEHDEQRHVLYVGKSKNIRTRVRTYFTAAEKRRGWTRWSAWPPASRRAVPDPAAGRRHRAAADRQPRPALQPAVEVPRAHQWIKITEEAFPRLSVVRAVREDGATYFGPFHRRQAAEDVVLAIYDGFPIRQCTPRLSPTRPGQRLRAGRHGPLLRPVRRYDLPRGLRRRGRAGADGAVGRRPARGARRPGPAHPAGRRAALRGGGDHPSSAGDADADRRPLPPGVAAWPPAPRSSPRASEGRTGRSTSSATAGWPPPASPRPRDVPQAVARSSGPRPRRSCRPPDPLPAAGIEETERIADWLERRACG